MADRGSAVPGVGAAILAPSTLALLQTSVREGPESTRAVAYYGSAFLTGIALPMILIGAGQGGALGPLTAAGIAGVAPEDAGAAGGVTNVAQQIGGSLGLAVLVAVFAAAGSSTLRGTALPATPHLGGAHRRCDPARPGTHSCANLRPRTASPPPSLTLTSHRHPIRWSWEASALGTAHPVAA